MKIKDVDVSLKYGKIFSKNWMLTWCVCLCLAVLFFGYTLCEILVSDNQTILDLLYGILVWLFCFVFFAGTLLYFILKNKFIKKKVMIWLNDAIEIKAYARETKRLPASLLSLEQVAIEVIFKYDGEIVILKNGKQKWLQVAPYLVKYANKKINILYSPTYNEVMILKDQSY